MLLKLLNRNFVPTDFLSYYNPNLPVIVACDASPVGLGSVLAHKLPNGEETPITYAVKEITVKSTKKTFL